MAMTTATPARRARCPVLASFGMASFGMEALLATGPALAEAAFVPAATQNIAAPGDPASTAGIDAQTWGLWAVDPGPRGVRVSDYATLIANGGVAPRGWQFTAAAWWLEEHGLIREAPRVALPPGQ